MNLLNIRRATLTWLGRVWRIIYKAIDKYVETDGELRAASFGFYALLALFPLILVFAYAGAMVKGDPDTVVDDLIRVVRVYVPENPHKIHEETPPPPPEEIPPSSPDEEKNPAEVTPSIEENMDVVKTLQTALKGALRERTKVSLVVFLVLTWSSLRFFQALVHGVNRAWGTHEYPWWRLPIANLGMVAILAGTLLLGVIAPMIMKAIQSYWNAHAPMEVSPVNFFFQWTGSLIPSAVLYLGLLAFYKYAPRRRTRWREVWLGALLTTILLQLLQKAFVLYWQNIAKFGAVYGTLGSVVAVLMWIYFSGSVLILGGCWCAAQTEVLNPPDEEDDGEA